MLQCSSENPFQITFILQLLYYICNDCNYKCKYSQNSVVKIKEKQPTTGKLKGSGKQPFSIAVCTFVAK